MGFDNGVVLRASMRATHKTDGDNQVNTVHYDVVDNLGGNATDGQRLADLLRDDVRPAFQSLYTAAWTIQPVVVMEEQDPKGPILPRREWSSGTPIDGSRVTAGELLPRATVVVAHVVTGAVGRRFKGRMFIGSSFDESDQSDGAFLTGTGHWQTILNYAGAWPSVVPVNIPGEISTATLVVYSRTQRGQDLANYSTPVTAIVPQAKVHWLRTREP